jgi:EAL domain-containing protein (putative c-di-GMP-specific phosphodiesterase class I)
VAAGARQPATRDELEECVAQRAFTLVYQPILELETGVVVGVEALCRFDDGASPQRRFKQAETVGLGAELDLAIIEVALADLPALPGGYVSVNLSPSTLGERRLGDVLLAHGVPADRIVLEITERARITGSRAAEQLLGLVRARGVRLAVDDAGAGYATLRHILGLRPDLIKMDRAITEDIDSDIARRVLAVALVSFAGEIGATVIAEGVETAGEILGVRRVGIRHAQGYVLARPSGLPLTPTRYEPAPLGAADAVLDRAARLERGGRRAVSNRALASKEPVGEEPGRERARRQLRSSHDGLQSAQSQLEDSVALGRKAGVSWDEIAEILGMTRQGAAKRFGQGRLF